MNGIMSPLRLLLARTLLLGLPLAFSACGSVADTSVSGTDGLDCNLGRLLGDEAMCKSASGPKRPAKVYCYRTLGSIDCYPEPNPKGGLALRPEGVAPTGVEADKKAARPTISTTVPRRKPVAAAEPAEKPKAVDKTETAKKKKPAAKTKPTAKLKAIAPPKHPGKLAAPKNVIKPPPSDSATDEAKDEAKESVAKEQPAKAPMSKALGLPARKPQRPGDALKGDSEADADADADADDDADADADADADDKVDEDATQG